MIEIHEDDYSSMKNDLYACSVHKLYILRLFISGCINRMKTMTPKTFIHSVLVTIKYLVTNLNRRTQSKYSRHSYGSFWSGQLAQKVYEKFIGVSSWMKLTLDDVQLVTDHSSPEILNY